jgi:hypothetical protein
VHVAVSCTRLLRVVPVRSSAQGTPAPDAENTGQAAGLQRTAGRQARGRGGAQALVGAVRSGADDVRAAALETMGNLAFARPNRAVLLACEGLLDRLARLAEGQARVGCRLGPDGAPPAAWLPCACDQAGKPSGWLRWRDRQRAHSLQAAAQACSTLLKSRERVRMRENVALAGPP